MTFDLINYSRVIDTGPSDWSTSGGPGLSRYVGQTFTAKAGFAEALTVHLGFRPVSLHVLVTEISVSGDRVFPGSILFESVPIRTTDQPVAGTDPFDFALGSLALETGKQYAFILDALVERDENDPNDNASLGVTDYFSGDVYKGGALIELVLGPFSGGSREEHFSSGFSYGSHDDTLFQMGFAASASNGYVGTAGADEIFGGSTRSLIRGKQGGDTIHAGGRADTVFAGFGNDASYGQGGNDRLFGHKGNDRQFGGTGSDIIKGGNGKDLLNGGRGDDFLTGGLHRDRFVFQLGGGDDRITDFQDDIDVIALNSDLSLFGMSPEAIVQTFAAVSGDDIVFTFFRGDTLTLDGAATLGLEALADDLVIV